MTSTPAQPREDFSLVLGGPLFQLYLRTRLSRPALELVHRRIVAVVLITWVPLFILAALAGQAIGGVEVPFIQDVAAHARFLLALPVMIGAELLVHVRIREVVEEFRERGLIAPEDEARFDRAIESALRWRNSIAAEVVMLVISFTLGFWLWKQTALEVPTWYGRDAASGGHSTPAGFWFAFVSLPLFRFILLRWYFRIVIWYRFLWTVSRLKLRLNALHPDRCGGLGFLTVSAAAFKPVLFAQSVLFAGVLGDWIWHEGASLTQYESEIVVLVVSLLAVALAPMFLFTGQLARARREGIRRYGLLASRYVDEFQRKWISATGAARTLPGEASADAASSEEPLLGSADIQSLADLDGSFDVIREMRPLPFGKATLIDLAITILLPIAPLVLTMIPLRELVGRLLKMVT